MSEATFFDRLEDELRAAASRPPRRRVRPQWVAVAVAAGALALTPLLFVGGDERPAATEHPGPGLSPVGTILPKGSGKPPRQEASLVVAHGKTEGLGLWQLEVYGYPAAGPPSQEDGMMAGHCVQLYQPVVPSLGRPGSGGVCMPRQIGERRTPHFALAEITPPRSRKLFAFGRAPARASKIVVTSNRKPLVFDPIPAPPSFRRRFGFDAKFFVVSVPVSVTRESARVNWLDASGRLGSQGLRLVGPPD